jgi:hypothetical protein
MMYILEYMCWSLIFGVLGAYLIGITLWVFIFIGMFLFPEMTSRHIENIAHYTKRLNERYNDLGLNSESLSMEDLE